MSIKRLFVLYLLFFGYGLMAQDIIVEKEIKKIDSLIKRNYYENAITKIDSLQNELIKVRFDKKHTNHLLELRFREALVLDRQDKSVPRVLEILFDLIEKAENNELHNLSCRIYLLIALSYEKLEDIELTDKYLDEAYLKYKKYKLDNLYSRYCIRRSSYYRLTNNLDSVYYYSKQAQIYSERYGNEVDMMDSYILLGSYFSKKENYNEALKYNFKLLSYRKKLKDCTLLAISFNNIAKSYLNSGNLKQSLRYSDSSYAYYVDQSSLLYDHTFPETRYKIYEALGDSDSAFHYFRIYHEKEVNYLKNEEKLNVKKLEEEYIFQNQKNVIKNKDQQLGFLSSFLLIIFIGAGLLVMKNRKIKKQNKIINKQVDELTKSLDQKKMLLSELQHRVKNNLQYVISILEIQKESVDFNNIDELIRGYQNRIHSMALLHKKLNISESVNTVDFNKYISELSSLVKTSYDDHKKNVTLDFKCDVETISIAKALPIGLIIVELVSNSMKHAFHNRNIGVISIEITKTSTGYCLYYTDNGDGFDFNKVAQKGLGQEIIKGLIDQLDGAIETQNNNGFELKVYFK